MRLPVSAFALIIAMLGAVGSPAHAEDFPLRPKYPRETFITTAELAATKGQVIIVDVRDQTEYRVLHIEGAKLLPVETLRREELQALRASGDTRQIVFYCNGITCEKSYKAAAKAAFWEIPNTCVYDAGVFDWAKAHPDQALFFDVPLNAEKVNSALIPESVFEAACLDPEAFKARAADPAFKIYDIRERSDRMAKPIAFNNDIRLVLDDFVPALDKGEIPREKILIYDNVGKQVMWLQYYLQKHGIKEYYFLKGGVRAIK